MREFYEKYKGRKAIRDGRTGIVCGYDFNCLIMAVENGPGWYLEENRIDGVFVDTNVSTAHKFWFIESDDILEDYFKFGR